MLSQTLIPVVLLIVLGYTLKHTQFVNDAFWKGADKLVFYILLPSLLFSKIATTSLVAVSLIKLFVIIVVLLTGASTILFLLQRIKPIEAALFTSVYQGATRFNSFVSLGMIAAAWTSSFALEVGAIIVSIKVILVNSFCILVFAHYTTHSQSIKEKLILIFKNPLIAACILGLLVNTLGLSLPVWSLSTLEVLGKASLTLGVLSVGAGLMISFDRLLSYPILIATTVKLALLPISAYYLGLYFELEQVSHQVLVLIFAMPTAASSYILAGQLGGNQPEMAKIITIETILSGLTMLPILGWIAASSS